MKLVVLLVACIAIGAVQSGTLQSELPIGGTGMPTSPVVVSKTFLAQQKFLLEILRHVDQPLLVDEYVKLGGQLITDQTRYLKYDFRMIKFENIMKVNGLLPRGEFFTVIQRNHVQQSIGLFNFFYYAKDWDTLVRNIVWARINVNPAMFAYTLTLAVIHRQDLQGLILPQVYEIFPQHFFNSKYILAAERFDWDVFNRQIMLEKELKSVYVQQYPIFEEAWTGRFYMRDWKVWQWWKLMGLDDGWQVDTKGADISSDLDQVWLPVDYTRDIEIWNGDSVISYLTEDVSWNAYWYYLNLDYSQLLSGETYNLNKDRRGEWWIYNVQQILARYRMERISQGLEEVKGFSWYGNIKTGYNPQLVAINGVGFTARKNYWEIQSYQNLEDFSQILSIKSRILDVIASGRFTLRNGTVLDLSQPESISVIGDLLQGNIDTLDLNQFGHWWQQAATYLSGEEFHDFISSPNTLFNFETMLRDPLTYDLLQLLVNYFYLFKNQLPSYTHQELLLPGVKIVDVQVSKLMTYFDLVDTDITTLLNENFVLRDGEIDWAKTLSARQMRLNHKPFTFDIQVTSNKVQKVVVRVFLGPEFDIYGQKISMAVNRENFMELDEFIGELVVGNNVIHRSSEDFDWVAPDPISYSGLYRYLQGALDGKYQYEPNITKSHSLFPDRLILPHGWVEGLPMDLFFMISPYTADYQQYSTYDHTYLSGIGSGVRHIDNMPFGYPLDRKIDSIVEFVVPNMYVEPVRIYHLDKLHKYYPNKYENYGTFDYNF